MVLLISFLRNSPKFNNISLRFLENLFYLSFGGAYNMHNTSSAKDVLAASAKHTLKKGVSKVRF